VSALTETASAATLRVAEGVHMIVSHRLVNWFVIEDGDEVTAVDAGFPPDWKQLEVTLSSLGRATSQLRAVVLTHGHIDHIGFARRAQAEGAAVYVHPNDRHIVEDRLSMAKSERSPLLYVGKAPTRRLMAIALGAGAFRAKGVRETRALDDGATLDVPGSPRVVFTPGHTAGHCAIHLPDRDLLFAGDALVMRDPYTGRDGPCLVARAATMDAAQAKQSLQRIGDTGAGTVVTGHGEPWTEGAEAAARLAAKRGAD
jgi:glyoxylase-like metal-dependent hydrolase (beta-lactamase superfamily II)